MTNQHSAQRNNQPHVQSERHDSALRQARSRIAELEAQVAELQRREVAAHRRVIELEARRASSPDNPTSPANARLNVLLSIGAALLVTHEIEPVLDMIVREAPNLFPGTVGSVLLLDDPETQHVLVRASRDKQITELNLLASQAFRNHVFMAPRAMLLEGAELHEMLNSLHSASDTTLHNLLQPWPPANALLAPLRDEQRCMGVLLLYCAHSGEGVYQIHDLPFAQTLADLAAVAITETYQRARSARLQRDLAQIQYLHREAQARLDAAQAQLLQSAKLAAIGELSASVAHEINNPLYAARNSLYLIEQDLPPESAGRQFLAIAQSELGRIARIITRMRDFYRPSRAEFVPTDVNSLLHDTVEFVQTYLRHSQIEASIQLAPGLPRITAHADQLRQVFLNIVLNACDAMHAGGELRITTDTNCDNVDMQPFILIEIADTGTGIAPEHREHLFEPFYTTKPQGTGLGLAISAHIVTQHAGQLSVESTVGLGSTFVIRLPIDPPAEPHEDDPARF
jgi:two-component system NtrC family sensor kinase